MRDPPRDPSERRGVLEPPLEPLRGNAAAAHVRVVEKPQVERDRGLHALHDEQLQRALAAAERLVAVAPVHDELRDERVVIGRDLPGVRVDTAAYSGWKIPPYYYSLIAKLIVHGRDRDEALSRGKRALELFIVEGVKTTIPLHLRLLDDPDVRSGRVSTKWLERWLKNAPPL